jgi:hypothetical protein
VSNGKIVFYPPASYAISFDESHYLEQADTAALDVGTGDFSFACLWRLDSTITNTTAPKLLVGKGALSMGSLAGWTLAVVPSAHKIRFRFNDGNVTSVAPESADDVFVGDRWYWIVGTVDRDGNLNIWLGDFTTGVLTLVLTYAVTSRPATWSNSSPLWMGNWGADPGNYFKGYLGGVVLDVGRLWSSTWIAEEWLRIKWGLDITRKARDFTAYWPLNQSLADLQAGYTPSYLPTATPAYVSGPPYASAPLTYTFARNPLYERDLPYVPHYQVERAKDKTAWNYGSGTVKRGANPPFTFIENDQLNAFQSAYEGGRTVNYYQDADNPQSLEPAYITEEPAIKAQKMPGSRYNLTLRLEEA